MTKPEPYPRLYFSSEELPRFCFSSDQLAPDGFGPFLPAGQVRHLGSFLQNTFGLRTCLTFDREADLLPCSLFKQSLCSGVCSKSLCSVADYQRLVSLAKLFLRADLTEFDQAIDQLIFASLKVEDYTVAEQLNSIKQQSHAFRKVARNNYWTDKAFDLFEFTLTPDLLAARLLTLRGGKVLAEQSFSFKHAQNEPDASGPKLLRALRPLYRNYRPQRIYLLGAKSFTTDNFLKELKKLTAAQIITQGSLPVSASRALKRTKIRKVKRTRDKESLSAKQLYRALGITAETKMIFSIDIAHLSNTATVCGGLSYLDCQRVRETDRAKFFPQKLSELSALRAAIKDPSFLPGNQEVVIFIDGGVGHYNAVVSALAESGLRYQVVALTKDLSYRNVKAVIVDKHSRPIAEFSAAVQIFLQSVSTKTHTLANTLHQLYHQQLNISDLRQAEIVHTSGPGPTDSSGFEQLAIRPLRV